MTDLSIALELGLTQLAAAQPVGLAAEQSTELSADTREKMLRFVQLLEKWNRVYNLTAIKKPHAMLQRHVLDSLVLCRWLPSTSEKRQYNADVVDVGSGAGLPVIPLALARPDLQFASIESNGKKTRFQQQVLVELGLRNVQILNQRVEDVAVQGELRTAVVTSRAFSAPHDFLRTAQPLCAADSLAIIMLGHAERLQTPLPEPFFLQELVPVDIPGNSAARHVAVCRCNAP